MKDAAPRDPAAASPRGLDRATVAGGLAAAGWVLLCAAWFDVDPQVRRPLQPALVAPLALGTAAAGLLWLRRRARTLAGPPLAVARRDLLFVLALAFFFRLPVVWAGAGATVTADGALSGIVALHVRSGLERLVFVPSVPYSGSLKSHVSAVLSFVLDPAVSFALASVLFYLAFVAGLYRLSLLVCGRRTALLAGLYVAFSPAFVTRYSLSNDGNYVEVLAFTAWALWLGARWTVEHDERGRLALAAGLLLGLGFWCHILAVIPLFALGALFALVAAFDRRWLDAPRSLAALLAGWAVGYAPGWLWNARNEWLSFAYLVPGEARGEAGVEAVTAGLGEKLLLMIGDGWPVLMGYDKGYGPAIDRLLAAIAWLAVAAALASGVLAARRAWRERSWPLASLLLFAATNLGVALVALPHVPGNPRYLLFLMAVVPVLLAASLGAGRWRVLFFALVATGAVASFAQVPGTLRADARWRQFVADMEREGVRWCYTDFFLATRVNFLSGERIVCTAKLGPTTTEYFASYRETVERAPEAAFIAVNRTSAGRLQRRLEALGVTHERLDLMKPVLLRLSRKVDPEELFPGREFPLR